MNQPEPTLFCRYMRRYIEFMGTLQNGGFWLGQVGLTLTQRLGRILPPCSPPPVLRYVESQREEQEANELLHALESNLGYNFSLPEV